MEKENMPETGKQRSTNLELYRIIVMLAIVAHHYVVNSGLMTCINNSNALSANSIFLLLFGCWGKVGINCFVLITGYFMCRSDITLKKFLKLVLEWLFYNYIILFIFILTGYQELSLRALAGNIIPFLNLTDGFTPCYVVFFLFIPFLNILIRNINEKQHRLLLILCLCVFSVWASLPFVNVGQSYVFWFMDLYLLSSYIRLYPRPLFHNTRFWGMMSVLAVACSCLSVLFMAWMKQTRGIAAYYYFLSDSNRITALAVSLCFFMFFKNLNIKYDPAINKIAASTFGVLCIHAASDEMRQWLWKDTLHNTDFFNSPFLAVHAIGAVLVVFAACTIIDMARIRFIETPFFKYYDSHIAPKIKK